MKSLADKLTAARALISSPSSWVKGRWGMDDRGTHVSPRAPQAVRWCTEGALRRVARSKDDYARMAYALLQQLPAGWRKYAKKPGRPARKWPSGLWVFNDHPRVTHRAVLALFDRAIAVARWTDVHARIGVIERTLASLRRGERAGRTESAGRIGSAGRPSAGPGARASAVARHPATAAAAAPGGRKDRPEPDLPASAPKTSPWGPPVKAKEMAPGIWWVVTEKHGGIRLSEARMAEMPPDERSADRWYERRREAAFVLRRFTDLAVLSPSIWQQAVLSAWHMRVSVASGGFHAIARLPVPVERVAESTTGWAAGLFGHRAAKPVTERVSKLSAAWAKLAAERAHLAAKWTALLVARPSEPAGGRAKRPSVQRAAQLSEEWARLAAEWTKLAAEWAKSTAERRAEPTAVPWGPGNAGQSPLLSAEWAKLAAARSQLLADRVAPWFSDRPGKLTAEQVAELFGDWAAKRTGDRPASPPTDRLWQPAGESAGESAADGPAKWRSRLETKLPAGWITELPAEWTAKLRAGWPIDPRADWGAKPVARRAAEPAAAGPAAPVSTTDPRPDARGARRGREHGWCVWASGQQTAPRPAPAVRERTGQL